MAIVKEYLSPITQIHIDPQSKEGLIHGGKLDVTSLLLERFSTYGERINEAFAEIINQGGTFHLFGNTLILNLGPEIEDKCVSEEMKSSSLINNFCKGF